MSSSQELRVANCPARSLGAVTSAEPTAWEDAELAPAVVDDQRGGQVAELVELAERARDYARNSKAANTLRAYESDLRDGA